MFEKREIAVSTSQTSTTIQISSKYDQKFIKLSEENLRVKSTALLKYGSFFYLIINAQNTISNLYAYEVYETAETDLRISDRLTTEKMKIDQVELVFTAVNIDPKREKHTIETLILRRVNSENLECRRIVVRHRKEICVGEEGVAFSCALEVISAVGFMASGQELEILATTESGLVRLSEYSQPCLLLTG